MLYGPDWNINMWFEFDDTPLLIAISNNKDDIAQELINAGEDLGMSNEFGEFPLYSVIHHSRINIFFEIINALKAILIIYQAALHY